MATLNIIGLSVSFFWCTMSEALLKRRPDLHPNTEVNQTDRKQAPILRFCSGQIPEWHIADPRPSGSVRSRVAVPRSERVLELVQEVKEEEE